MQNNNSIFEELLRDIEQALNAQCYYAALALALSIPDICGKAEYPDCDSSKFRYVAWYDTNLGYGERVPFGKCADCEKFKKYLKNFSVMYKQFSINSKGKHNPNTNYLLPCHSCEQEHMSMLNGSAIYDLRCSFLHSGNPSLSQEEIPMFSLMIGNYEWCDSAGCKSYEVHVKNLCKKLVRCGRVYYNENTKKFNFFKYNMVDIDERKQKYDEFMQLNKYI